MFRVMRYCLVCQKLSTTKAIWKSEVQGWKILFVNQTTDAFFWDNHEWYCK